MIAIIEDDKSIRELVLYALKAQGFEAVGYSRVSEFREAGERPELLLLDIMLPEEDGLTYLQTLRAAEDSRRLPVILLTARDSEFDKILGLDSGADDYVTKPFSMLELVSRVKAVLRRVEAPRKLLRYRGLQLDDEAHRITLRGEEIEATLKEYNTLKLLLRQKGKVVTREELLNQVWGYDFLGETRTVDVHIRTLRAKLGDSGEYIETVRGVGYRIGGEG